MNETADYTVAFGKIARTLVYTDAEGSVVFTFDISVSKNGRTGKSRMFLDRRPVVSRKSFEPEVTMERGRVDVAIDRSRRYLEGCGYEVEIAN